MTSLFFRSNIKIYLVAAIVAVIVSWPASLFLVDQIWIGGTAAAVALLCILAIAVRMRRDEIVVRDAIACCVAVGKGDFESRINTRSSGQLDDLLFSINDLIDRTDAFMREASASMEYASRHKFFRRIIATGMIGVFLNASKTINSASQAMQNEADAEKIIEAELAGLVEKASCGEFTHRIDLTGKSGFNLNVSSGLNKLVGTVDSGLSEVGRVLKSLSQSDLTQRMEGDFQGAFLELKEDMNAMVDYLGDIVRQIRDTSANVQNETAEVSVAMRDLAGRTESQAANLEETAAATEEMTAAVKHNADSASQANELASGAQSAAMSGRDVVAGAIDTMSKVSEFSNKISSIAGVIEDIAFQTSLLALNAGVEAARAGESGRGFAVVASEVRALSQRSSDASNEVKTLIRESVAEIRNGVERVNLAGTKLDDIVTAVRSLADLVAQISLAGREQSTGLSQVNSAVAQMDEMTQKNAALVEEVSAASDTLKTQIESLVDQVMVFQLPPDRIAPPARVRADLRQAI